jgi:S-adenosylmethionine/arginine decarboxylase-like enzyme
LSESHLSIHTFPEKKHISFDIYTCRQYSDDTFYNEIFKKLSNKLQASLESTCKIIDRHF